MTDQVARPVFTCLQCGSEFTDKPSRPRIYCSRKCLGVARRGVSGPGFGRPPRPEEERFWEKVDRSNPTGCWPWLASLTHDGYGKFGSGHAHRKAYQLTHGPLTREQHVLHKCDAKYPPGDFTYRRCCQPAHMFIGANPENIADMLAKGRQARGERVNHAKLTRAQAEAIRERYAAGGTSQRRLAAEYGVSKAAVQHILNGVSWT